MADHPIKNSATGGSKIEAGGNVHFGDINIYQNEAQKPKKGRRTAYMLGIMLLALMLTGIITGIPWINPRGNKPSDAAIHTVPLNPAPARPDTGSSQPTASRMGERQKTNAIPSKPDPTTTGGWLSGMVTDPDGNALGNVNITAVGTGAETLSGVNGQFRIFISEAYADKTVNLRFSKPGYKAETFPYFEVPKNDIVKILSPVSPEIQ